MSSDEINRLSGIKNKLERRAAVIEGVRAFFHLQGFIEIETPLRVPAVAPERFIKPLMSENWFLSTSPELQMKRLLSAGYEKIFQICHCFRKGERGRHHNPEFTMLEWYRAGADYRQILEDTENLVLFLAERLGCGTSLEYQGNNIDLKKPWQEISVQEAYQKYAGWDPVNNFDELKFDDDMADNIIPSFVTDRPTVIKDYPAPCAALARLKSGSTGTAERAEVFIGGLELANAYSELNDPEEQEKRFRSEIEQMHQEGKAAVWPDKFMQSIGNMPPCGGIALGIDRLVMLFCNTDKIDDVIAFPSDLL
jgi:elongation factor P--(R)-beta-lysine ligase